MPQSRQDDMFDDMVELVKQLVRDVQQKSIVNKALWKRAGKLLEDAGV